ncbi:MAG TPA: DUF1684 domain-containing protein [Vicinamibacterales bacterium]|jgi:hypothetical protein
MSGNSLRRRIVLVMMAALAVPCVAPAQGGAQKPAATPTDPVAAILASHKTADDAYANAPMSPFTAVAVQYFSPGQAMRLGIGPSGAEFGTSPAAPDIIELTLDAGAFWVTPVAGTPPLVVKTSGEGDVSGLPGAAVTGRTKLAPREVVRIGRFFVELYARPDTGNARVFDPELPARTAYAGLKWYPPAPSLQVKARYVANPTPAPVTITTSRGLRKEYFRVGTFEFSVDRTAQRLTVLASVASPKAGDELFVAFRDLTTGNETYEVGRYLFIPCAEAGGTYVLDFNKATNPLCNYSPHYNCPIPPKENLLTVPIRAGEMKYPARH